MAITMMLQQQCGKSCECGSAKCSRAYVGLDTLKGENKLLFVVTIFLLIVLEESATSALPPHLPKHITETFRGGFIRMIKLT